MNRRPRTRKQFTEFTVCDMLWEYASLAAKYDIYSPLSSTPDSEIKLHIWKSFEKTVVNLLMHVPRFQLLCDLLYCFYFLYVSFF